MNAIAVGLKSIRVGEPVTSAGLTMLPLLDTAVAEPAYLTLDDAVASGSFRVTEVSEAGRVPELLVLNDLGRPVLIVDGEELVGAKQNRIVNLTILVPPKSRIHLPVSCVEAGRWHHRTHAFGTAKRAHYASGRAMKLHAVTESYRHVGRPVADQSAIWDDIAAKSARFAADSDTSAMDAMFECRAAELEDLEASFPAVPGQLGALFLVAGAPVGLDLFDSAATWQRLAPKLVASYGLDALDRGANPGVAREPRFVAQAARDLLARVLELGEERYPSVGLGEDVRLSGPGLAGGALVVDDHLVHLAVFPR